MKIIGIIPARYESIRFPGKPLIDLKGKSMIRRVFEGVSKSDILDEVIVATDDQRIADEVNSFGGKVLMTSPNHASGTDRCGEVAEKINCDVVINIQGDEPLVDYRQIDLLASCFSDPEVNIATLGIVDRDEANRNNVNRVKIVTNVLNDAMYFSRAAIPFTGRTNQETIADYPMFRHIGLYAYRKETLSELIRLPPTMLEKVESLEQLRWLFHGYKIRVIETTIETPNIDVPEDVDKVLEYL